ncbi:NPC intracellular cholesterol transporter 2 homolog a-like [Anthonomus grandis grandis]|uniref:NPC intracellular cholesterol transporter 2 homolog a-like n=1 Tax=Anthonomus grandis grandis TaxID=2921223 RepID=UPI0021660BB0|nr:NPC intracellular cholesterol transporter 2 homolog a-like [Anthonomus grandis grandis]
MHHNKIICFLVLVCSVIYKCSRATEVNSCSDESYAVLPNITYSVNSYVCESTPCICYLGCATSIDLNFTAPRYLEKMKPQVLATYAGVTLNYGLNQDDACDGFTNTQCPIVKDELVNYKYLLTIPAIFPEVTVTLRFSLIDKEVNKDFVCFEFDIKVQRDTCPT